MKGALEREIDEAGDLLAFRIGIWRAISGDDAASAAALRAIADRAVRLVDRLTKMGCGMPRFVEHRAAPARQSGARSGSGSIDDEREVGDGDARASASARKPIEPGASTMAKRSPR